MAWNAILTYQVFSNSPRQNDGSDVTENVVVDYSTDLSEMADNIRASIVTVMARSNGLRHMCSGIIFAEEEDDVFIFTSDQIVSDGAELTVYFDSSAAAEAEVAAVDSVTGSALLKVRPGFDVTVMKLAAADVIRQGEYAAVMGGRSPVTNSAPVSFGVISQPGQRRIAAGSLWFSSIIDCDAVSIQEMTGGPLMNVGGQLLGMIVSRSVSGDRMTCALSVAEMQLLYEEFKADGRASRGSLGISVRPVADMLPYEKSERDIRLDLLTGVLVTYIAENTETETILHTGDILVSMDGEEITDDDALRTMLYSHAAGDTVVLSILRKGESQEVSVVLE